MAKNDTQDNQLITPKKIRIVTKEKIAQIYTLLRAKILKGRIPPDDRRTIQKHIGVGRGTDYYISSVYLQNSKYFNNVILVKEDKENGRFVYKGIVGGADNAIGVIESNVSLEEIVASPYGNETFLKMLSESNATVVRDNYYKKYGLPSEKLDGHCLHYSSPVFALGTIIRDDKGRYSFYDYISEDTENCLEQNRKQDTEIVRLQDKGAVAIPMSSSMVVAEQDCELFDAGSEGVGITGTNNEAIPYRYTKFKTVKFEDYYITVGKLRLGEKTPPKEGSRIDFTKSNIYPNVVVCTRGKNLIQYCTDKFTNQINFSLGRLLTIYNIESIKESEEGLIFAGIIELDENGKTKEGNKIPDSVRQHMKKLNEEPKTSNIIDFTNR